MKVISLILPLALSFLSTPPPQAAKPTEAGQLDAVLKKMDAAAVTFNTTQADFESDRYEKVINEIDDVQKGTVYYRRIGKEVEMKMDIKMAGDNANSLKPEPKYVLFSKGVLKLYQPKADQVTVYDAGKYRSDFESYLVLGFGGSGQDLQKQFDVTYMGEETVMGVNAAKLQLVPKSERVRNNFKSIILWIDPERGISVQQQFFEPQGDYRLAKYPDIKINQKIPNDVFQLKTTSKTQTVSPKG